jgi:hypothetical protein
MNKKIVTSAVVFGLAMMLGTSAFAASSPKGYGGHGDDGKKKKVIPPPKHQSLSSIIASILGLI